MAINDLLTLEQVREYTMIMLEQQGSDASDFWPPDVIDSFIVAEHQKVIHQINAAYEEFFTEIATTDIVGNQEFYQLPDDFRTLQRLEYSGTPGTSQWTAINPKQMMETDPYWVTGGVSPAGSSPGISTITYSFVANAFRLVPYFNTNVTAGLRIWYTKRIHTPQESVDAGEFTETRAWVPFNGLLRPHHEILAMGAVIRCKFREEVDHRRYAELYADLYRALILDIEQRQVQGTKQVRETEDMY